MVTPPIARTLHELSAVCALSLVALLLVSSPIRADELTVEPSISVQGRVDDNPLLRTTNHETTYIGTVSPQVALHDKNDQLDLKFSASANLRAYSGLANTNSDDEIGSLDLNYLVTELTSLGLNASVNRITLLDQLVDNNGQLTRPARSTNVSVAPSTTFLLSPVNQFQISGFFTNQTYDAPQLVNYREYGGSLSWTHALNDLLTGALSVIAERAEPDDNTSNGTDIYAAEASISYTFPNDIKVALRGGPELIRRDIVFPGQSADQLGFRLQASVKGSLDELTDISARVTRESQPTSAGGVTRHDSFHLDASRKLGPRLSANVSADYVMGDAKSSAADNLDNYLNLSVGAKWQITELSSFNLSYSYRREAFINQQRRAISNGVYLTFQHAFVPRPQ
ncbi:MAG: outer membrane beta-barrel protein [Alphaproteobacteria bacterium]